MNTLNLAQALKRKNRLAGEIARLKPIVKRENSRKESTPARADVRGTYTTMVETARQLAALKGAISTANAAATEPGRGIYGKLNLQAELRGLISETTRKLGQSVA